MKKIFVLFFILVSFLSSISYVHAKRGFIDELLNISHGHEIYELSNVEVRHYSYNDLLISGLHQKFVEVNDSVKQQIISNYRSDKYKTREMDNIIYNYKKFVFYTNELFYNFFMLDRNHNLRKSQEFQDSLINNFKNMRVYYKKLARKLKN